MTTPAPTPVADLWDDKFNSLLTVCLQSVGSRANIIATRRNLLHFVRNNPRPTDSELLPPEQPRVWTADEILEREG